MNTQSTLRGKTVFISGASRGIGLAIALRSARDGANVAIAKYGMSLCVLGMAGEFRSDGIAVNALWPRTIIDTAALQALPMFGPRERLRTRKPDIVADAAHVILTRDARSFTGQFCIDEDVLRSAGVTDLSPYLHENASESELMPDLFV